MKTSIAGRVPPTRESKVVPNFTICSLFALLLCSVGALRADDAWPRKYEDFEGAKLLWPYTYDDKTSTIKMTVSEDVAKSGKKSLCFEVNTKGTGEWGAGGGCAPSISGAKGGIDVTGATKLTFWIKTEKKISLGVAIKEGNAPGRSELNEEWKWGVQEIEGKADWQQVKLDIDKATIKKITGNGKLDMGNISNVDFFFSLGIEPTKVYVDDIAFEK
jgi:hypothetical protein